MSDTEFPPIQVRVLGSLALAVEGRDVPIPGAKRRAMLALLALADGVTVTTTDLIDVLWPDDPPRRAGGALQSHVSRLRAHLGAAARLTVGEHGYRLLLQPGELDVHVARDGLAISRRIAHGSPARRR